MLTKFPGYDTFWFCVGGFFFGWLFISCGPDSKLTYMLSSDSFSVLRALSNINEKNDN